MKPLKEKITSTIRQVKNQAENRWGICQPILWRINQNLKSWPVILMQSFQKTMHPSVSIMAAAVAYFSLLSIFPLIIFTVAISSFWFPKGVKLDQIIQQLEFVAPNLGTLLGKNINEIIQSRGTISGLALISLLWTASSLFYMLSRTMSTIWSYEKEIAMWKRRGTSILLVLLTIGPLLFLASFASPAISAFRSLFPPNAIRLYVWLGIIISILADIFFFFFIYLILPHGKSTWRSNLPGAVFSGLLWEGAKRAFILVGSRYLRTTNLIYGSVATIVVLMVWVYVTCLFLFFGCYVNVNYHNQIQARRDWVRELAALKAKES